MTVELTLAGVGLLLGGALCTGLVIGMTQINLREEPWWCASCRQRHEGARTVYPESNLQHLDPP